MIAGPGEPARAHRQPNQDRIPASRQARPGPGPRITATRCGTGRHQQASAQSSQPKPAQGRPGRVAVTAEVLGDGSDTEAALVHGAASSAIDG